MRPFFPLPSSTEPLGVAQNAEPVDVTSITQIVWRQLAETRSLHSRSHFHAGLPSIVAPRPTRRLAAPPRQVDIDAEIALVHGLARDAYRPKFPELESLVHHAVDYARVLAAIGNEMDLTLVDLEHVLPQATIMVVSVTASTTSGKPLPPDALAKARRAASRRFCF